MEEFTMAHQSKRDYLRSMYHTVRIRPPQSEGGHVRGILPSARIPQEVCHLAPESALARAAWHTGLHTPRPPTYSKAAIGILAKIWEASGYLCSQRLKAALPAWLPWARQRFRLSPTLERQLVRISPRQMDRRLRDLSSFFLMRQNRES